MKPDDAWKQYQAYTRDVTEHARKLGFAAGAICWFFKRSPSVQDRPVIVAFPQPILWSLSALVLYFACDLFHSLAGSASLRFFLRREENRQWKESNKIGAEFDMPPWVDYPATGFFILKITFLFASFGFLGLQFFQSISGK